MSERHTITAVELDEWLRTPRWQTFASSACNGSKKKLLVDDGKVFRVIDHGETVFLGIDRDAAITAYNAAR